MFMLNNSQREILCSVSYINYLIAEAFNSSPKKMMVLVHSLELLNILT